MNALSDRIAQPGPKAGFRPRAALLAVLLAAPLLAAVSAPSQAAGTDQPIVASLNPPPAGLACDAAAAATSVYFQFANPPFQVSQVSLYLDGKGVPQDAVDEHWPTVTLSKGLHPGSNTVDIVANGASGQHIERRMVVQVGGAPDGATGTAQVACDDNAVAQDAPEVIDPSAAVVIDETQPIVEDSAPEPVVVQDTPPVIYDTPPQVVYSYPPPVYVYSPYPVVAFGPWVPFVPFFSFGFFYSNYHPYCPPPRFVVNNNYYGHGGWNGGGWHGGGNNGGGWHGGGNPGNNGNGWHGGGNGGNGENGGAGWHGGGNGGNNGGWHGGGNPGNGNGWHGAPVPVPARPSMNPGNNGSWHAQAPGAQQNQDHGWQGGRAPQGGQWGGGQRFAPRPAQPNGQFRANYNSAPMQQFRPAQQFQPAQQFRQAPQQSFRPAPQQNFRPSAPAFHGGGGGNGGGGGHPQAAHGGGFGRR